MKGMERLRPQNCQRSIYKNREERETESSEPSWKTVQAVVGKHHERHLPEAVSFREKKEYSRHILR